MFDIISLSCPSCGGKLEVTTNMHTLICQHCGNESLVRSNENSLFLESFAKCPVCQRNDKVEKISAIFRNNPNFLNEFQIPQPPDFPLNPDYPNKPNYPKLTTHLDPISGLFIFGYIWLIFSFFACMFFIFVPINNLFVSIVGVIFFVCLTCFILYRIYVIEKKRLNESNQKLIDEYEKHLLRYEAKLFVIQQQYNKAIAVHEDKKNKWLKANEKLAKTYYCHRDDIVFIPGEKSTANPETILPFLYQ